MKKIHTLIITIYLIFSVLPALHAADKQYAYTLDYSSVPSDIFKKMITINVSVGTCSSCNVTADGTAITCTYTASTGTCAFSLDKQYANLVVTAVSWTSGGTGAATKATLWENRKWAYSFTFDDCYATDYTSDLPYLSARNMRAGVGVVTSWIGGGNYLSRTQLDALFNAGWGILNHSTSHPQGTISCSNLATYCGAAKTTLESWYPNNYKNIYYIYPYLETGYQSCLATAGYFHGAEDVDGTNYVDTLPTGAAWFNLYRHGMYANITTAQANAWADAAATDSRARWNITFTHMTYSGSSTPGQYDTNEATLQPHFDYVYKTYGDGGTTKNMWFAPSDEVLMYLFMRQYLVINSVTPPTPTSTPPVVATATRTPASTATYTRTCTRTGTPTVSPTLTLTDTSTSTVTGTPTSTSTASPSSTPTCTATRTITSTATASASKSATPSYTITWSATASVSSTFTNTQTHTATATVTVSGTGYPVPSITASPSVTSTRPQVPSETATPSVSSTWPPVPSVTASPSATNTPASTSTSTSTSSVQQTQTDTPLVPSPSATASMSSINTPTKTWTSQVPSETSTKQPTATYTPVNTFTMTNSATASVSSTPTFTNTQTRTFTRTATATVTQTLTLTSNPTGTATATLSPQPSPASEKFGIKDTLVFPNPYDPLKGNVMFQFDAERTAVKITIRIYTASFRRVFEEPVNGPYAGRSVAMLAAYRISKLASGTYYVVLAGEGVAGEKAVSKPVELIILR